MLSEVAKLCQTMVRIPSVNPQAKTAFQPPYGEQQMAQFVCNWLNEHHLNAQIQTAAPNRLNVLAVAPGKNPDKTLLLSAHLDTVDVRDMNIEPFSGQHLNGKILGRGSSDDKGPLAAMMIAFRNRAQSGNLPHNLALLATCGEEFDRTGSDFFATQLTNPKNFPLPGKLAAAIFAEPTNLKVIFAHRGVVRLQLTTQGQSAHSSRPEKGKNAIYPMARAITAVE
ncbi:MAG: M20/M25/M40 family metallo-hydrolase, partial [Sedimentisphaerales bacterium]|nr:M20/M25/M40 family metallo-hydrolase [Sedimentisphaerales bacterium]